MRKPEQVATTARIWGLVCMLAWFANPLAFLFASALDGVFVGATVIWLALSFSLSVWMWWVAVTAHIQFHQFPVLYRLAIFAGLMPLMPLLALAAVLVGWRVGRKPPTTWTGFTDKQKEKTHA